MSESDYIFHETESERQLREKYIGTGEASADDIDVYVRATASADFEATFYETVRVRARNR